MHVPASPDDRVLGIRRHPLRQALCAAVMLGLPALSAQASIPQLSGQPTDLTSLSLEELGNIQITSVSKKPERLADAAASVFVITAEDIRRSGARSLPEALRLAPNLQVAEASATGHAISARGMNGSNSSAPNKLLVLIDGRSVYSPLFSGVFWDAQEVMLEDVERIEVISGPGGTLWGVNAVNGVSVADGGLAVTQEYSGGYSAQFALKAPVVLGVQTASKPPRYVSGSKLRQASSATIGSMEAALPAGFVQQSAIRLAAPESGTRAEMIAGTAEQVAAKLVDMLAERGLVGA